MLWARLIGSLTLAAVLLILILLAFAAWLAVLILLERAASLTTGQHLPPWLLAAAAAFVIVLYPASIAISLFKMHQKILGTRCPATQDRAAALPSHPARRTEEL
jgi:hypothetical protein